jgi:hypothetical protein
MIEREKIYNQQTHEQRKAARESLRGIYEVSKQAHYQKLLSFNICPEDAMKQIKQVDASRGTRRQMYEYVKLVMSIEDDFAVEVAPYVQAISWLFDDES